MSSKLRRYGLRILIAAFIYLFFRFTSSGSEQALANDINVWPIILLFAIVVVLAVWEVCDRVIIFFGRKKSHDLTKKRSLLKVFLFATLATFPLVTGFIYFEVFYLKVWLNYSGDPGNEFLADIVQAFVVTWLVIAIEILKTYYHSLRAMEVEQARMQKELMRSQYETLKNQVNPHFLFNNFSVLTALIHKDADLASDFVTQLSKIYRYILDNTGTEMISLTKELEILDSYLFLLKIRHEEGISIIQNIELDTDKFVLPTLSMQMLIENAVKHNKFSKAQPLLINIYNDSENAIVVQNQNTPKESITSTTKIGLENIRNRYNLKSSEQVVVYQSEDFFKVKLPIFSVS
ncbi:MAG: histidine kinase [Bacteroidota bacterium]